MATGLYVLQDGSVMVAYGRRHIPISYAQYKANGYKPVLEELVAKSRGANKARSVLRSPPPEIVGCHVRGSTLPALGMQFANSGKPASGHLEMSGYANCLREPSSLSDLKLSH